MVLRVVAELALAESGALHLDLALGGRDRHRQPLERSLTRRLHQRLAVRGSDAQASAASLNSVDGGFERELEQRLAVEVRRKRLPDPADRLAQPRAFLGELVEAV